MNKPKFKVVDNAQETIFERGWDYAHDSVEYRDYSVKQELLKIHSANYVGSLSDDFYDGYNMICIDENDVDIEPRYYAVYFVALKPGELDTPYMWQQVVRSER